MSRDIIGYESFTLVGKALFTGNGERAETHIFPKHKNASAKIRKCIFSFRIFKVYLFCYNNFNDFLISSSTDS